MMVCRVNEYYGLPCSAELKEHMRGLFETGSVYQRIFDELRACTGSTSVHAANLGLTERDFNHKAGIVGARCVEELVRIADCYISSGKTL